MLSLSLRMINLFFGSVLPTEKVKYDLIFLYAFFKFAYDKSFLGSVLPTEKVKYDLIFLYAFFKFSFDKTFNCV
jgi:hypothetical protein